MLKQPLEECVAKFIKLGILRKDIDVTAQLAAYQALWPVVRKTATSLIQLSRRQLESPPNGDYKPLLNFINTRWAEPDYIQRISKFFGLLSMEQLKQPQIAPKVADTLVIPTYDLPGRYAGLLLLTLHESEPPVLSYRSFPKLAGLVKYHKCAGVTLLPQAIETRKHDKLRQPELIVYCDTVDATRAYLRWLRGSSEALPMVIPVQQSLQATKTVWQYLPPTRLVFAGAFENTIGYASRSSGDIAVMDRCPFGGMRNMLHYVQQIKDEAIPWQQVVINKLVETPAVQRTDVFMKMNIAPASREAFINQAPVELRQQITAPLSETNWRTFPFQHRTVVETASGWWLKSNKPISAGIIRIDRIVSFAKAPITNYGVRVSGRVLFKGVIYPFETTIKKINARGLFKFIATYLLEEHGCFGFWFRKEWNARSFDLALAAYKPQLVKSLPELGWNTAEQKFAYNNFVIESDGTVNNNWMYNSNNRTEFTPTYDIPRPTNQFPSELIPPLEQTDINSRANWMLAAAVLHNIIAPYAGRPMQSIVVAARSTVRKKFSTMLQSAAFLGCGSACLTDWGWKIMRARLAAAEKHNFPINTMYCTHKMRRELKTNPIASKLIIAASPAISSTDYQIVVPEPVGYHVNNWAQTLKHMLPYVLQFMLQSRIAPINFSNDVSSTYVILEKWLQNIGASTQGLNAAIELRNAMITPEYAMLTCIYEPRITNHICNYAMRMDQLRGSYLFEHMSKPYVDAIPKLNVFTYADHIFIAKQNFEQFRRNYIGYIAKTTMDNGSNVTKEMAKYENDYYVFNEANWIRIGKVFSELYED